MTTTMFRIELGGEVVECEDAEVFATCDRLVAKYGGVPQVNAIAPVVAAPAVEQIAAPVAVAVAEVVEPNKPAPVIGGGSVCMVGAARSQADFDDAVAAGFAPAQPVYTRGYRVAEAGVENARKSREEWAAMPSIDDACGALIERVRSEQRADEVVNVGSLRFSKAFELALGDARYLMTHRALQGIASRVMLDDGSACGGAGYLARIRPELRAINLNHLCRNMGERESIDGGDPSFATLRTRRNGERREVFALTSDSYTAFDADRIAAAIQMVAPADSRGTVCYDGARAKFELVYHSDVDASEYVAGEFFKVAIRVQTDDTGRGGVRVSAALFQNLCLNLIIIDEAVQTIDSLRHIGSVEKLARRFETAFADAQRAVRPFLIKWGQAAHEDCYSRAIATQDIGDAVPLEVALPGFFNAMIERELVPVRGRREAAVAGLVEMYQADTSSARVDDQITRAALVNAITRYAHVIESDPFAGSRMEEAAGRLIAGPSASRPLPCIPMR